MIGSARRFAPAALALSATLGAFAPAGYAAAPKKFEWTTKSADAKRLLAELQGMIENFQFGPPVIEVAEKVVKADPSFAMGEYYLSAVTPAPGNQAHLDKAVELGKKASDGERRFIETMVVARANQGADVKKAIPDLERLGHDYPNERLVQMLLGQIYAGQNDADKARAAFERALVIGPKTNRARAFLANDELLHGEYKKARETFLEVEKELPKGTAPFVVRYGIAFSYLYESQPDPAIKALETYLAEYKDSGAAQGFPEVFIWNSIARINLEDGRFDAAMKAYENGYASVPGSNLPEDQKQIWLGRLHHGKCRTLARMGKAEEAWAEAEMVRAMIEKGGEPGKQFMPAYHYLAGYLMLEKGDSQKALEHLKQSDTPANPFHTLLLARAYERLGDKESAKKSYALVVESKANGLERALAFPEAKKKLTTL